jgi:DNA-binding IclR family transcriptional regulator
VRSVARAVEILVFVAAGAKGRSSADIAAELGIPVPTAYHLLNTLVDEGALYKYERRFYLGPTVGLLADAFFQQDTQPPYAMEPLRELSRSTGETVYLATWRHDESRIVAMIEGANAVRVAGLGSGQWGAAHARASGKLLLALLADGALDTYLATHALRPFTARTITDEAAFRAELARIRQDGYAIDSEEFADGVSCVAAPIRKSGAPLAALALSAPTQRFEQQREEYVSAVLAVARSDEGGGTA